MADITDKFLSVGRRGTLTTLEAPGKPIGATSLKIRNPGNWPSDSLVAFSIRRVYIGGEDAGKEVPGSYTEYTGILNPEDGSIDSLTLEAGEDQAYGTGPDVQVMIHISNTWAKKLVEGLGVVLTRAGELKNGIVRAAAIATGAVTEEKIATGAVTADKIASATITPAKLNPTARGDYSTNEVNTGRKWVGGQDIFEKTINLGALPNSTTKNVAHGVTIGRLLGIKGHAHRSGSNAVFSLPHSGVSPNTSNLNISVYVNGTNIVVETGVDRSPYSGYVTIEYIK